MQDPLEGTLQARFVDLPEVALDTVHQHHRDFLGVAFPEFRQIIHLLFRPPKSQCGRNALDGVARVCAQVTVCLGDEDYLRVCHGLTVSPSRAVSGALCPADATSGICAADN